MEWISEWKTIICHHACNNGFIDDRFADSTTSKSGTWLFLSLRSNHIHFLIIFLSFSIFFLKKISKHLFLPLQSSNIAAVPNICGICSLPHYTGLCNALSDKIVSLSINYLEINRSKVKFFTSLKNDLLWLILNFELITINFSDTRQTPHRQFITLFRARWSHNNGLWGTKNLHGNHSTEICQRNSIRWVLSTMLNKHNPVKKKKVKCRSRVIETNFFHFFSLHLLAYYAHTLHIYTNQVHC